ncbi:MAG: hypothetical protein RIR73_228 [Chloroflexota bacterium]
MSEPSNIVFVCEHGAAKSVIAATFFNKLAKQKGINLQAIARGTQPDEVVSSNTLKGLVEDGFSQSIPNPKKLLPTDLETAVLLVSFCDLSAEGIHHAIEVEQWGDVPPVSKDYQAARDVILKNIYILLEKLEFNHG